MFKFISRKPKVEWLEKDNPLYEFGMITLFCPCCKKPLVSIDSLGYCFDYFRPYCYRCGQKLNFLEWKNKRCMECGTIKINGICLNCEKLQTDISKKEFLDLCNLYCIKVEENSGNPGFFIIDKGGIKREIKRAEDLEALFFYTEP